MDTILRLIDYDYWLWLVSWIRISIVLLRSKIQNNNMMAGECWPWWLTIINVKRGQRTFLSMLIVKCSRLIIESNIEYYSSWVFGNIAQRSTNLNVNGIYEIRYDLENFSIKILIIIDHYLFGIGIGTEHMWCVASEGTLW